MNEVVILGSGPSAAATALALTQGGVKPLVIDIGARLENANAEALIRMSQSDPGDWTESDRSTLTQQPVESLINGLPEKRAYGSNFPFRDSGQLAGVRPTRGTNRSIISSAYGGFSNVWGAQVMPFSRGTLNDWPISLDDLIPHYKAVLAEIPFSGVRDDLDKVFPILGPDRPLPPPSERTIMVLSAYARHRRRMSKLGITMGQARLAVDSFPCVRCGLCMTGCPYSLVYSASQTFDRLRRGHLIDYRDDRMAIRVKESRHLVNVQLLNLRSKAVENLQCRRLFIACGAIGTTRLVASSLELYDQDISANESAQFTVPFVSIRPTSDPRYEKRFTLNQFNMILQLPGHPRDISQIHFYTYNDAFYEALPAFLRKERMESAAREILRRTSVGIGYLPSSSSPKLILRIERPKRKESLPQLDISREEEQWSKNPMLKAVKRRITATAPLLDLWPLFPRTIFAAGAKSYHFGSTFPHSAKGGAIYESDLAGRVGGWDNIHLVDASVFPTVPATTFTLTIMANAHRIASRTLDISSPFGSQ